MNTVRIGSSQIGVMQYLIDCGPYPGSGWQWDTRNGTARILKTLVARGFVDETPSAIVDGKMVYSITDEGRKAYSALHGPR